MMASNTINRPHHRRNDLLGPSPNTSIQGDHHRFWPPIARGPPRVITGQASRTELAAPNSGACYGNFSEAGTRVFLPRSILDVVFHQRMASAQLTFTFSDSSSCNRAAGL